MLENNLLEYANLHTYIKDNTISYTGIVCLCICLYVKYLNLNFDFISIRNIYKCTLHTTILHSQTNVGTYILYNNIKDKNQSELYPAFE